MIGRLAVVAAAWLAEYLLVVAPFREGSYDSPSGTGLESLAVPLFLIHLPFVLALYAAGDALLRRYVSGDRPVWAVCAGYALLSFPIGGLMHKAFDLTNQLVWLIS